MTTRRFGVIVGKSRVMTVLAGSEDEARSRASSQLDKPGRYHIKRRWQEEGERVEALDE